MTTDDDAKALIAEAREEAARRYASKLVEDYDGDRYDVDEFGYDDMARQAFVDGVEWAAALEAKAQPPVTHAEVEAAAEALWEVSSIEFWGSTSDIWRDSARRSARAALEAARAVQPTVECPHWEPGRITRRRGCTACEAEAQPTTNPKEAP